MRFTLLLLSLSLLLLARPALGRRGRHSLGFSFGSHNRNRYNHCHHCRSSVPPLYGREYSHYSSQNCWCMHCLIGRWGRFRDICPRCSQSLFIRNERPYCPRCYLTFRYRRCRLCSALVLVGVPAYEDGPRWRSEREKATRGKLVGSGDEKRLSESRQKQYLKWMDLGLAQMRAQQYEESAKSFRLAMSENPNCQVSQFYLGLTIGATGQTYRGGTIIDEAIKESPILLRTPLDGHALFGSEGSYEKIVKMAKKRKKERAERVYLFAITRMSNKYEKVAAKLRAKLY